jgi:Leucine rich repeat
MPHGFASFFPDIEELYVTHCELKYIARQDFKGMKLTSISFYKNHIKILPYDVFFDLFELKFLSFFSNKIEEIPLLLFRNLHKLESVSFRVNNIQSVPLYAFENNKKLKTISFAYNQIFAFAAELIWKLPNLQSLLLESNSCIDRNFNFELDNSKNATYETIVDLCHGNCYYESLFATDCSGKLKECEDKVENEWKENES